MTFNNLFEKSRNFHSSANTLRKIPDRDEQYSKCDTILSSLFIVTFFVSCAAMTLDIGMFGFKEIEVQLVTVKSAAHTLELYGETYYAHMAQDISLQMMSNETATVYDKCTPSASQGCSPTRSDVVVLSTDNGYKSSATLEYIDRSAQYQEENEEIPDGLFLCRSDSNAASKSATIRIEVDENAVTEYNPHGISVHPILADLI